MTIRHLITAALLMGLTAGCGEDEPLQPPPDGAVDVAPALEPASWEGVTMIVADEFDPYPQVEQALPQLAAYPEVALCIAVREEGYQTPELESLLKSSARQGVPIMAWLLLPEAKGYWFNEENLADSAAFAQAFVAWIADRELPLGWILFDMEMSLEKIRQIEAPESITDVVELLEGNLDAEAFGRSRQDLTALVRDIQSKGYKVTAAAYPFVLDDRGDDDESLQDAFNTPLKDVPFDEIYFMTYRTTFKSLLGLDVGPHIIYQYAQEAQAAFGSAGALALGIIAGIGQVSDEGFSEPSPLADDIAAARAGGQERVFIFSLDGMFALSPIEPWLDLAATPPALPPPDSGSQMARDLIALLDMLL